MKPSTNVPLTKAQRQGLLRAADYFLSEVYDHRMAPAVRNAVTRLKKADPPQERQYGSGTAPRHDYGDSHDND